MDEVLNPWEVKERYWKPQHNKNVYATSRGTSTSGGGTKNYFRPKKNFLPLRVTKTILYDKLCGRADFPRANPMREDTKGKRRQTGNYCKFHKDYGHETDHCIDFAAYVDDLAQKGEINEYVKETGVKEAGSIRSASPEHSASSERRPRRIIN